MNQTYWFCKLKASMITYTPSQLDKQISVVAYRSEPRAFEQGCPTMEHAWSTSDAYSRACMQALFEHCMTTAVALAGPLPGMCSCIDDQLSLDILHMVSLDLLYQVSPDCVIAQQAGQVAKSMLGKIMAVIVGQRLKPFVSTLIGCKLTSYIPPAFL